MHFLHNSERKRGRKKYLKDIQPAIGSSLKWTPKPNVPVASKENDAGASGANTNSSRGVITPPSHKGGRKSSLTSFAMGSPASKPKRIYIDPNTRRAMRAEVESLPLPATLSAVCLALRSSAAVLDAHADADYSLLNDDEDRTRQMEILGSSLGDISLSPTQQLNRRKDEFRSACSSLVSGGNRDMLNSWDEVEKGLSQIFNFARFHIDASANQQNEVTPASIPTLSKKKFTTKRTPKKAHRRTPKKERPKMAPKLIPSGITLDQFREHMKKSMGYSTFRQIFQQAEILQSKPKIASDADVAARLDEQIAQKELERRSTQRVEDILAAKEKADKEREAKESASKLLRPLTSEEQSIVDNAIKGIGRAEEILARQEADSVQRGSMQTLGRGQWLNDEIINYFLKNCLARRDELLCAKQSGRKRSHFFNSFFVQTMFDDKNNNAKLRGKYNYKNVKRWGKKVPGKDVFNLKYIVCPINLDNLHWTSAVIFVEEKRIQYYDSMGGTDWNKLEGLLQYLKDEWKAKKGGEMNADEWELVGCSKDTPRQMNGFDCGVFTCMFCDFISKDCPLVFNQSHIDQCRERIALSIMKNCAIE